MGTKTIEKGEQIGAAEREMIECAGRPILQLTIDDVQDRIVAAVRLKPHAIDFDAIGLELGAEARSHAKNGAVKGDGFVHARAGERNMVQSKRRHSLSPSSAA